MTSTRKKQQKYLVKKNNKETNEMAWLQVEHSEDIICYETKGRELHCRIEARLNQDNTWNIFKIYFDTQEFNFVEEYFANNNEEVHKLIDSLKDEKQLSKKEILNMQEEKQKVATIKFQRIFKEIDSEKWALNVNSENLNNFFLINYEDKITLDIILFEGYKVYEEQILNEIHQTLGTAKYDASIETNLYYFTKRKQLSTEKQASSQVMIGKIEMDFKPN